jgi:uncharacterized protein YjdB
VKEWTDDGTAVTFLPGDSKIAFSINPVYMNHDITVEFEPIAVTGVSLNKTALTVGTGSSETLTANIIPADALNKTVVWTSSDEAIAVVDGNGKVTGVTAGTATITVKTADGDFDATCTVTVTVIVHAATPTFTAHPQPASYTQNETAAALTAAATVADGGTLTWQWYGNTANSNESGTAIPGATADSYTPSTASVGTVYYYAVATNTNDGVNGVKTATAASDAAAVTVTPPATVAVTGVTLNKPTLTLTVGGTATLTATVAPADATDKTVTWSSSDDDVATVSNGLVTAKAAGTRSEERRVGKECGSSSRSRWAPNH